MINKVKGFALEAFLLGIILSSTTGIVTVKLVNKYNEKEEEKVVCLFVDQKKKIESQQRVIEKLKSMVAGKDSVVIAKTKEGVTMTSNSGNCKSSVGIKRGKNGLGVTITNKTSVNR